MCASSPSERSLTRVRSVTAGPVTPLTPRSSWPGPNSLMDFRYITKKSIAKFKCGQKRSNAADYDRNQYVYPPWSYNNNFMKSRINSFMAKGAIRSLGEGGERSSMTETNKINKLSLFHDWINQINKLTINGQQCYILFNFVCIWQTLPPL